VSQSAMAALRPAVFAIADAMPVSCAPGWLLTSTACKVERSAAVAIEARSGETGAACPSC
jgi:hypothetical protein